MCRNNWQGWAPMRRISSVMRRGSKSSPQLSAGRGAEKTTVRFNPAVDYSNDPPKGTGFLPGMRVATRREIVLDDATSIPPSSIGYVVEVANGEAVVRVDEGLAFSTSLKELDRLDMNGVRVALRVPLALDNKVEIEGGEGVVVETLRNGVLRVQMADIRKVIRVDRAEGQNWGVGFSPDLKLVYVVSRSAGCDAGLNAFIGCSLKRLNGQSVTTPADILSFCKASPGGLTFELQYKGADVVTAECSDVAPLSLYPQLKRKNSLMRKLSTLTKFGKMS
eukprot:TRINITY_DN21223_c0_g1_i1.p1 TRINITY_DN21223_c0_g1~~TRINITY_DN21223_c0_g1_i1.p1  ORF type:complete len:278 (+),score=66.79 TRINITY_DN21223_c0_g1_i1:48-881(+)